MENVKYPVYKVKVEGIAPLLIHKMTTEETAKIEGTSKKISGKKAEDPKQVAESYLYLTNDGKPYVPSEYFYGAMVKVASNFRIPGKGKKTYKGLIKSAIDIVPDVILIKGGDWVVDTRTVVNPNTRGNRMIRHRPKFVNWYCEFEIVILDEQLSPDVVKEILEYAGRYNGIGDYRPRFGRFTVTEFQPK